MQVAKVKDKEHKQGAEKTPPWLEWGMGKSKV